MKYVVKDLICIIPRQGIRVHETMNFTTDLCELDHLQHFLKIMPKGRSCELSDCEYISFKEMSQESLRFFYGKEDTWGFKGKKNNLHTIIALCIHSFFFKKLLLCENRKFLSLMTLQMISIELIISQEVAHLVRGCDGAVSSQMLCSKVLK